MHDFLTQQELSAFLILKYFLLYEFFENFKIFMFFQLVFTIHISERAMTDAFLTKKILELALRKRSQANIKPDQCVGKFHVTSYLILQRDDFI